MEVKWNLTRDCQDGIGDDMKGVGVDIVFDGNAQDPIMGPSSDGGGGGEERDDLKVEVDGEFTNKGEVRLCVASEVEVERLTEADMRKDKKFPKASWPLKNSRQWGKTVLYSKLM